MLLMIGLAALSEVKTDPRSERVLCMTEIGKEWDAVYFSYHDSEWRRYIVKSVGKSVFIRWWWHRTWSCKTETYSNLLFHECTLKGRNGIIYIYSSSYDCLLLLLLIQEGDVRLFFFAAVQFRVFLLTTTASYPPIVLVVVLVVVWCLVWRPSQVWWAVVLLC